MTARTLKQLRNNDGLTIKQGKIVEYKTGYQVADYGTTCTTVREALKVIKEMQENCGIWYSDGIYYIDHSFRVKTRKEALTIGREHSQISVFKWSNKTLVYC